MKKVIGLSLFLTACTLQAQVLRVDEASLSAAGFECDVTSRLQKQCDGRTRCEVQVNERLCAFKHAASPGLEVRYRCDQTRYRVEAPWGERLALYCEQAPAGPYDASAPPPPLHVPAPALEIREARYGLPGHDWCDATWGLANRCNGKAECRVRAGNHWCGDPVRGEVKQMQIRYRCGWDERMVVIREKQHDTLSCHQPATSPNTIQVVAAEYGIGHHWCNARPALSSRCDGDYSCSFKVDNGLCGDPARNRRKEVHLVWRCGWQQQEARFAEGDWAEISCMQRIPRHTRPHIPPAMHAHGLKILSAAYGQLPARTCDATHELAERCNGKSVCKVKASNRLCGDPAHGVKKSLKVEYACDGRRMVRRVQEGQKIKLMCR